MIVKDKARRYQLEKWWWVLNMITADLIFLFAPGIWAKISLLYLNQVSIYALVITAGGAEQAAKAAENVSPNSPMRDFLKRLIKR